MKIYLIGSLRNTRIPDIANALASDPQLGGHEVFADWFSPGPEADGFWKAYEERRGRNFLEAIKGPHAKHVFDYDKKWLDWAEVAVLALPAGRSAHLELGYMIGQKKPTAILLDEPNPERWDIMYRFADLITPDICELYEWLGSFWK